MKFIFVCDDGMKFTNGFDEEKLILLGNVCVNSFTNKLSNFCACELYLKDEIKYMNVKLEN